MRQIANTFIKTVLPIYAFGIVLFALIMLFFGCVHPELLSYQEQYQLFLYSCEYFMERITVAGGLADYVSEFLVQFYYIPWAGAAVVALVLTLTAWLVYFASGKHDDWRTKTAWALVSAVPSLLFVGFMGDENALLSFPVAIDLVLIATLLFSRLPIKSNVVFGILQAIVFVLLYWFVGAVAIIFALASQKNSIEISKNLLRISGNLLIAIILMAIIGRMLMEQYPTNQVFLGINYYRIANEHPNELIVIVALIMAIAVCSNLSSKWFSSKKYLQLAAAAIVVIAVGIQIPSNYDSEKFDALLYDKLVREGQWFDIVAHAEKHAPQSEMALQGLNLALAKTGQLGDRMFQFPQNGMEGLIASHKLDNTSCLISAEAFFHLGMVNSAFRYYFDLQESIINNRKSGRFMKRMAECLIINGKYKAASKYINKLKQSLFYSDWTRETEKLFNNEAKIDAHPIYGEMRQLRFKKEMLYNYGELGKMLGILATESNGKNILAWDYFCAAMLLSGDLQLFTGMYHYANEMFHIQQIPRHHQEAIAFMWTFGHQSFDGIPFPIGNDVKQQIVQLAQAFQRSHGDASVWRMGFEKTYWTYYLLRQQQQIKQQSGEQHASREG